jgi:large subunit ribosomal protein L25
MAELILRAEPRTILGKKVKQLRRNGRIPAVVYGPVLSETVSVSVDAREFDRFYYRAGHATLFTLKWEGGEQAVVIRDVQMDPVKQIPIHADFFAPNLRVALTASVPINYHNEPEITDAILTHNLNELQVSALPAEIPQHIEVDLSSLAAVGDSVRAGDVTLPNGVTLVTPEDEILAILSGVAVEEEPEEVEAADEEAAEAVAEEGAEAEAESGGESESGES